MFGYSFVHILVLLVMSEKRVCGSGVQPDFSPGPSSQDRSLSVCSQTMSEISKSKPTLEVLDARLKAAENHIEKMQDAVGQSVIFSAKFNVNGSYGPFDKETTIIYNNVITNIGNAYNSYTGVFAAPIAGVYYFNFFYHAGGSKDCKLLLYKNNKVVVQAFSSSSDDKDTNNGGNAVYLQLKQGDQVFMCVAKKAHVWADDDVTTFSGRLVHLCS